MECGKGVRKGESNENGFIIESEGEIEEEVENEPKGRT